MANENVVQLTQDPKFSGFTDEQVNRLFEKIAYDAILMVDICRSEAEKSGISDHALIFHSLARIASGIGAMADAPTGGRVVGCFTDWFLGPLFNEQKGD